MTRWLLNPAAVKPGATMPALGLIEQEARDLTVFLFSQPYNNPLQ
jgi:cytochrome c1